MITAGSEVRHPGSRMPVVSAIAVLSSRLLAGRGARVGYSVVAIASIFTSIPAVIEQIQALTD